MKKLLIALTLLAAGTINTWAQTSPESTQADVQENMASLTGSIAEQKAEIKDIIQKLIRMIDEKRKAAEQNES